MAQVTVGGKTRGGWQVTGADHPFRTRAEAEQIARQQLAEG